MICLYHGSTVDIDRVGVQIGKYEAGDITLDQFLENLKLSHPKRPPFPNTPAVFSGFGTTRSWRLPH